LPTTFDYFEKFNLKDMKENKNPFDEHIQSRLSDFESPVPMDLFDRLQAQRGGALPSDAPLRERLEGHESPVPMDLLDRLQTQRGGALPSDASIRERLEGFESPVSDKFFDNVMAERKRRNRRVWLWRSATAVAALWLLGIVVLQLDNKNTGLDAPKSVENPANTDLSRDHREGVADGEFGQSNVGKSVTSGISTIETTEKTSNTEGNQMTDGGKSPKSDISNPTFTEGVTKGEFRKSNFRKSSTGNIANPMASSGSNVELKNNNSVLNTSKTTSNTVNTDLSRDYREGVADGSNRMSDGGVLATSDITNLTLTGFEFTNKNAELNSVADNQLTSLNRTVASFDLISIKTPQILTLAKESRKNPCSNPDNGCPTFGMRRRGLGEKAFYVDAFVAPEYVMRSFIKNLPESEKLLVARDSVEKTQYAVSTGVRASFVLGNGLAIRAGAIYNQINEKARFDSLGIGTITTSYKVNVLPNGQLDTVSFTRTVTDGIFRKTRYNHYRTIDIPVQIGFEKNLKNGWGIGINGGAIFNITAWRKADIVGADLRQLTVSSGINAPNPVFSTRLGMSLLGSVAVYRQLTDNLQAVIEPSLRYGLQPITRTDYALKQQYSTVGMLIGLRLKL
jgi:hypothetical protein